MCRYSDVYNTHWSFSTQEPPGKEMAHHYGPQYSAFRGSIPECAVTVTPLVTMLSGSHWAEGLVSEATFTAAKPTASQL